VAPTDEALPTRAKARERTGAHPEGRGCCVKALRTVTGHRSSEMIARYRPTSRTFAELGLADLVPLDQAIPELRSTVASGEGGPGVGEPERGSVGQESNRAGKVGRGERRN
jgi:hypothetical protein